MFRIPTPVLTIGLAISLAALTGAAEGRAFHLALERSSPAAGETLPASPDEVRLWFSQTPQASATVIRLVDGETERLVELGPTRQDPDDARAFAASVAATLGAGSYTVRWRTMAADGHVVRGTFNFVVQAERSE